MAMAALSYSGLTNASTSSSGMHCLTAMRGGRGIVDDVERIASEATQPLCYVLSFDAGNYLQFGINFWLICLYLNSQIYTIGFR